MRTVEGRVIRAVGGLFGVLTREGESFDCRARGVLKLDGPVLPGDIVTVMLPDGAADGRGAAAGPRRIWPGGALNAGRSAGRCGGR